MSLRIFEELPTDSGEAIIDKIRRAIRLGVLPPGTPLVQEKLAKMLNLSRVPVREALLALATEGMVTFQAGGGARVTMLSVDEIEELYSLRLLLDTEMSKVITKQVTETDLGALRALVTAMSSYEEEVKHRDWSEANFNFHVGLYRASRMPHFERIASQVLNLTETYSRLFVFELGGLHESQMEHTEMLEAMEAKDDVELARLLTKHSSRARQGLIQYASRVLPSSTTDVELAAFAKETTSQSSDGLEIE
jgi:DNA-binding GntR family transcriptional regulator